MSQKMKISLRMIFIGVDMQFGLAFANLFKTSISNPLQQKEEIKSLLEIKNISSNGCAAQY